MIATTAPAQQPRADTGAVATRQVRTASNEIREALAQMQQIPGAFPAVSAVVVHGDATPLRFVQGTARAGHPGQVDHRSLFYIASQTKSFMALLAAHLDETRVLPLDTTLAQIWPQLKLPAPADPAKITMADLLSHQENLRTDTLNFLTAYVRDVPAADYPAMLARYTQARSEGFRYANLGDLIYGAALETRTGRPWQAWLQHEVLRPLRLDHVYSRSSRAPERRLTWNHRWDGRAWIAYPPKPDGLMHAAGGLLASSDGMAAWMRANLRRRSPTGTPSAGSFARAQRARAKAELSDGEFVCDGYSLGWYSCAYKNQQVLMHPGGYVGVVSVTLLLPAMDTGLSLVVNSDSAMEGVQLELMKAFIGLATGQADERERLRALVDGYPARLARTAAKRGDAVQKIRDDTAWGGWNWSPSQAQTQRYLGRFESDRLGRLEVVQGRDGLQARLGAMQLRLMPASPGLFGASKSVLDAPEPFRYDEAANSLRWNDDTFVRVPVADLPAGRATGRRVRR
ncbi:MAG: beta-lactamase family protein [Lysobacter sp.]|nr:beta-lactamase family protein [Lysobacter sp.]